MPRRPRASFLGVTYAGWATRQANLERHVGQDGRLDARFHRVTGWNDDGLVERLPVPAPIRGTLRATIDARSLATIPRPDVFWTSGRELLLPYLWAFVGPMDRPLVVELDWTLDQQEAMAPWYYGRAARTRRHHAVAQARQRAVFAKVELFTPMSRWAADGLRDVGVTDDRIRVLPPGLDLQAWSCPPRERQGPGPLRLLFVGGDFRRKGGDLLVDAVMGALAGRVVLDIVTRDDVAPGRGVAVHRSTPNSPELRQLYAQADLFVMPTRADCFGHAIVEAMASGLPAIVGDVGGVRDIVDHGRTGWCIAPTSSALTGALTEALARRQELPTMGACARRVAEQRFDGARNDHVLVDLMLELAVRRQSARRRHRTGGVG